MALSTELLKRLNSIEEPLPKRLKLAKNTFYAVDVPIIHKEDLILQWLCKTCPTNDEVWESLKSCLKNKHLDITTDVKRLLIKILIQAFENDIKYIQENIFECCNLLISNNGMQRYYISEPEELGLLVCHLVNCTHKIFKCTFNIEEHRTEGINVSLISKSSGLVLVAYNTVISVIENITQFFKFAFTTKESSSHVFVRFILYPLCNIIDHNCTDNTNRLGAATHKCIQQLIFTKKYAQSGEFVKDEDMTRLKNLLSVLTEGAKLNDPECNLRTFNFFFRVTISTFKSDTTILDNILRELVECLETHKKEGLNSLLKHLSDLTFDFNNKINGVTLFDYCQNVMDNILTSKSLTNVDYYLLAQFCCFNPLIVERRIQDILRKVFAGNLGETLEYKCLMIFILNASVHLRQEEKLISAICIALRDCLQQQISVVENDIFFPTEFKEKLMKAINNITNSQTVVMLRTLTYHLKVDCLEKLESGNTCNTVLMLQAIVELLITFLDGICIFEYSKTSVSYKKFINAFDDLKTTLSPLIDKICSLNLDKEMVIVLTAVFSCYETQRALQYYVPSTIPEDFGLPILENQWQKLIKKVKKHGNQHCKDNMNKLILQQVKINQNSLNKSSMMLNSLIGGLECCWHLILEFDTEVILSLNNEQVSKLTHLLLADITSNADNFNKWIKVLHNNNVQENKRLMISVLNDILQQIGDLPKESVTNSITKHFNKELLLQTEIIESEKINDILLCIREELCANKWIQIPNTFLCKVKVYLEVLLHLPLMFLSKNVRLITFMFVFALRMECDQSNEIVPLCNTIFSDLLEKSNIDVFQYIDPPLLLQQLSQNKIIQKTLELFLRNCSYANLKKLVKCSTLSNNDMLLLLESMERVKPKVNVDQKVIIKKAEAKLMKIMVKILPFKITNTNDLKILNLVLRISITSENIDEKLKNVTELTIQNIFTNDKGNETTNELLQDGLQLMIIILRSKKVFEITNQTVQGVWCTLFKYPCTDVLLPLLESSELKELDEFLVKLHIELERILLGEKENDLENICIIWNALLKTNMSNDRNKLRLTAINNLMQTIQTVNVTKKFWPNLLKLIQNILITKHLYLPGHIIDLSIIHGLKSLQENTILICSDTLALCNVLLKIRTNVITDRIPSLLVLYRRILNIVIHKSKVIDRFEEHAFKCLTLDIEKFTSSLIKLKKDMVRISPYLVADLLELYSENSIASFVKISLQNCINQLISICDQHGIALLSRTLPVSMQEIFKTQLDMYNKFYKFSGKI